MANWVTVKVQVPAPIQDLAAALDSLLDALLAILSVVQAILDIVKAFLVGLLDPLAAIIEAIINEIESLLNDIRQIGVYISGDLEIEPPFENLLGGFSAYERRMIARLVDRTDPTRPDFTSRSGVFAVFMYASFDASSIAQVLDFIDRIKAFLGIRKKPRPYTIPVGLEVAYGATTSGLGTFGLIDEVFRRGLEPTVASIRWQLAPPANSGPVSWPLPSPPGFLIEISTEKDGLQIGYVAPAPQAAMDAEGQQDRAFGLVLDPEGRPFRLYGGKDLINTSDMKWTGSGTTYTPPDIGSDGKLQSGKARIYAYRGSADNVGIPIDALITDDGKYLLQRTFYVDVKTLLGINIAAPGQPFSFSLNYEDMPYKATFTDAGNGKVTVTPEAERARTVYVRVSAVTSEFAPSGSGPPYAFQWTIDQNAIMDGVKQGQVRLALAAGVSGSMRTDPSAPLTVTFPNTSTKEYLDAVATAIAVLVLARADLPATDGASDPAFETDVAGQATGLEDFARFIMPQVTGPNAARFFGKEGLDPITFRGKLLVRCRALANELLARTGPLPSAVEEFILDSALVGGKPLAEVLWSDLDSEVGPGATILDSLDTDTAFGQDVDNGIAPNPLSVYAPPDQVKKTLRQRIIDLTRSPGFLQRGTGNGLGRGSADYSPVLYTKPSADLASMQMKFCRNVLLANPDIFTASADVLKIASGTLAVRPGNGAWTAIRLFPQGIPPVDAMLNEIMGFLRAIQAGTKAITDLILSYIEFIEARILEIEALIRRIQALLNAILIIEVPSVSALIVSANGTDGILQELVTAENKPQDSATSSSIVLKDGTVQQVGTYGAGVVLLAGGLPAAVIEILQLMFPEEE